MTETVSPSKFKDAVLTWGTFLIVTLPILCSVIFFFYSSFNQNSMQDYRIDKLETMMKDQQTVNILRVQQMDNIHSDVAAIKAAQDGQNAMLQLIWHDIKQK